jgi:hypothetical protein
VGDQKADFTKFTRALIRNGRKRVSEKRKEQREFSRYVYRQWKKAIDLFEIAYAAAADAGAACNEKDRPRANREKDVRFVVLARLHAKACTVTGEVLTLMAAGYASGAYSRWRTLHEVAVTARLIWAADVDLAKRYMLHERVESAKAARLHLEYQERLGLEPIATEEVERVIKFKDSVAARLGKEFDSTYGWASGFFGLDKPTFAHLEKAAGLDHWRPYYLMASWGVHASPKGSMWNIGVGRLDKLLLAGASALGLADPGHQSLIALLQTTSSFLSLYPTKKKIAMICGLSRVIDLAGEAFLEAHSRIEPVNADKSEGEPPNPGPTAGA